MNVSRKFTLLPVYFWKSFKDAWSQSAIFACGFDWLFFLIRRLGEAIWWQALVVLVEELGGELADLSIVKADNREVVQESLMLLIKLDKFSPHLITLCHLHPLYHFWLVLFLLLVWGDSCCLVGKLELVAQGRSGAISGWFREGRVASGGLVRALCGALLMK